MPTRPCLGIPGQPCGRLTNRADSRCTGCASAWQRRRGTRHQRGYDGAHERAREQWRPAVEAGTVDCARCGVRIGRGQAWALDHTDDRTGYLGPSHKACNDSAGGKATRH